MTTASMDAARCAPAAHKRLASSETKVVGVAAMLCPLTWGNRLCPLTWATAPEHTLLHCPGARGKA